MMIRDNADNRSYVTLLSLIAENSGKFDICALVYDICTGNKYSYFNEITGKYEYESIEDRLLDICRISSRSYKDLKVIVRYIMDNFVYEKRDKDNPNNMVVLNKKKMEAEYISMRFDDVFIHKIIEQYYHGELKRRCNNADF